MINVFDYTDYRLFLRAQIEAHNETRGYQSRLAEAAGCKRSFLSQVLHSNVSLTPDQAAGLSQFWNLSEDETDWFMELVALARAGSPQMRRLCTRRLDTIKMRRANLSERLKPSRLHSAQSQAEYYSSWYWSAIHMMTCIPAYTTPTKISERLQLRLSLVEETLAALEKMGLVKSKNGRSWHSVELDLHVPKASKLNMSNHTNWRQQAIAKIQLGDDEALHYTAVHALSADAIEKIKAKLILMIQESREIVKPSSEEELVCLSCDLFKI
jgi:uncharacterized protein (TIGR02147 family)